jgi:hypothetical protein
MEGNQLQQFLFTSIYTTYKNSIIYESKSKNNGAFQEKHIYSKYTETKLILLFKVISLDLNAPAPAYKFFFLIPSEKSFLVASLTKFAPRQ